MNALAQVASALNLTSDSPIQAVQHIRRMSSAPPA